MLEDLRNHDAHPSPEEMEWMAADGVSILARAVVLAGVALAIGLGTSMLLEASHELPPVATSNAQ